jgi:hypothetical protein
MDILSFQKSINKELSLVRNRVRNFIGGSHWGEDGSYKEAILKNVIKRYLPSNISIGTGFVISELNGEIRQTTQIDLILYDNSYPLLFQEGDFIITTPKSVRAIIEVKSKISNSKLSGIITKAKRNAEIINTENNKCFNGIFAYEYGSTWNQANAEGHIQRSLHNALVASRGKVTHLSLGKQIFIRHWAREEIDGYVNRQEIVGNCQVDSFFNIYRIRELSFSYFISNLIDSISPEDNSDRFWYMYPLPEGKESHRVAQVCL